MKIHVHKLRDDGTAECLQTGELNEENCANISFEPEDVTEPWTILVEVDKSGLNPDTVYVTLCTTAQFDRLPMKPKGVGGQALIRSDMEH